MLRALFVAALGVRLLVDMSTPLMPGAFRFDPAESVEAHRTHSIRGANQPVIRPTSLPQVAIEISPPRADAPIRRAPDAHSPLFRPLLPRHAPDPGPEAAEDH